MFASFSLIMHVWPILGFCVVCVILFVMLKLLLLLLFEVLFVVDMFLVIMVTCCAYEHVCCGVMPRGV